MKNLFYEHVIVGAGAVGTAAAYHLARRGARVLLIEQFGLGHAYGSSHGPSRIIRYSYADPGYAALMGRAFESWRKLEADAGESVYTRTGGISLCAPHLDYVSYVAESLQRLEVPYRRMNGAELRKRYPVFQVSDDEDVVFEPEIGLLAAGRIVRLQAELAQAHGGERFRLMEQTPVDRLDLESERPAVIAGGLRIECGRLIVTAGPWASRLLPTLGVSLEVTRQCVAHFRPANLEAYSIGRFPVFIRKQEAPQEAFYGMPDYAATGVKAALHHVGDAVDPDRVDRTVGPADLGRIHAAIEGLLPGLRDAPVVDTTVCLYTVAPDENFVVGPLSDRSDVIIASACGGHGFKFANLVGGVLADLALEGQTGVDRSCWLTP